MTFDQLESIRFSAPVQSNRFDDRLDQGQRAGTFRNQPADPAHYANSSYMGLTAGSEISVRTNETIESGAVLGTLLGAIAGGGKGAAIGALAGGAAGVGAEVLTAGERVHVPAETVLNFRLDQAVNLNFDPRN